MKMRSKKSASNYESSMKLFGTKFWEIFWGMRSDSTEFHSVGGHNVLSPHEQATVHRVYRLRVNQNNVSTSIADRS
jgi:hypothetical protein